MAFCIQKPKRIKGERGKDCFRFFLLIIKKSENSDEKNMEKNTKPMHFQKPR